MIKYEVPVDENVRSMISFSPRWKSVGERVHSLTEATTYSLSSQKPENHILFKLSEVRNRPTNEQDIF